MGTTRLRAIAACFTAIALSLAIATLATSDPVGSSFTYQGQLTQKGKTLKSADVRFTLYDAETGGTQIASTIDLTYGKLLGGRFAARLDFGRAAFNGEARWLEIAVRTPSGTDAHPGVFKTLTPRQLLTAAPYALYSMNGGLSRLARPP